MVCRTRFLEKIGYMIYNPHTEEAYQLMHDGILALARAEQAGIRVDVDYVERKKVMLERKMKEIEEEFRNTKLYRHWQHSQNSPVNLNSGVQLGNFLYNVKKIEPSRLTENGKGSTDEEALQELNIPELDLLLKRSKLKKTWDVLDGFAQEQVNGYVHPAFNLHLVRTYRSSSDSPNFQNIPKRDEQMMNLCRKAIYPRPGHQLLEVDYGQLEVRISACYNKDQKLIYDILEGDMHSDMAKQIFYVNKIDKKNHGHNTLRQAAKNGFIFPEFYGDYYKNCAVNVASKWCRLPQGVWSPEQGIVMDDTTGITVADHLARKAGIRSMQGFEKHLQRIEKEFWYSRYVEYTAWKEMWWKMYQKYGYISLKTGFFCSGVMKRNDCINYPVQGAAFHCLLWSFIQLDKFIRDNKLDSRLIGQIHDSMIIDINPSELRLIADTVKKITCVDLPKAWKWIIVPLEIDMEICPVDASWVEKSHFS